MSWEWSHTQEAYDNGRKNLAKKSLSILFVILAEWRATAWNEQDTMQGPQFDQIKYDLKMKELQDIDAMNKEAGVEASCRKEQLAEDIWEHAEQLRTCTNGGHQAWVCPYGCHLINWQPGKHNGVNGR